MAPPTTSPNLFADLHEVVTRLRAEEKKLRLIQEIGAALSSPLDLDQLLWLIMEKITLLMEGDRSTLYLLTEDGTELWSKVAQGQSEPQEIRLRVGEGIAGWVARSAETVNIPDAYNDRRFQPAYDLKTGYRTRSILCMPMRNTRGATIGVIQVLNKQGGPFSGEDETLLASLAGQAAVSIENSKLYHSMVRKNSELLVTQQRLEQKSHELHLLYEIESEMNASLDLDELLERLLRRAMALIGTAAGSIVLVDRAKGDLYFRTTAGEARDVVKRLRLALGQGIVGWVAQRRTPILVNDPAGDPRHLDNLAGAVGLRPRNLLCAPLIEGDQVLGAIELLDKTEGRALDESDLKLLVLIAGQASKAIQLARAKEDQMNQGRLAAIGQMLSGVLHDLKTPMTIVSGYAQLMAQCDEPDQRTQYVDHILKQFDQMAAMTKEVLSFAKGESNVLIRKVFLHKFLEEVSAHLEHEFAGREIEFLIDAAFRGAAWFDEQKMLRVVHNVARNAAQAMPTGGHFRLSVRATGPLLIFEFADTGVGIPTEMEGRLFDAFATAGKQDGTGLGLAIVKKIVDEHSGRVSHRANEGRGTVFVIELPLEKPPSLEGSRTGEMAAVRP